MMAQNSPQMLLVTGANGFVGRSLCNHLKKSGHSVVGAVRHSMSNISETCRYVGVGEINEQTDWRPALEGCEVVIHLAARVHVMNDNTLDPMAEFLKVNLHGTLNLAKQAAFAGVKRFVYVSSIKVNGEYTDGKPFTELDTVNPQDPYAVSKWQSEQGLHEISQETGMELVVVRPPLVYGPGVKANFHQLLKLVHSSVPLPLGRINNRRSMIYLENLVDALMVCATHPQAGGQTYLLSDSDAVSTAQLVGYIASAMQKPSHIFSFPISVLRWLAIVIGKASVVDRLTQSLEVDSRKITLDLSWRPPYKLIQGLNSTATWFLESRMKVKK